MLDLLDFLNLLDLLDLLDLLQRFAARLSYRVSRQNLWNISV